MAKTIEGGLTTNHLKQFQNSINSRNQFTRDLLEKKIEETIIKHSIEGKLPFIESNYELQGTMQFPFEPFLCESTLDLEKYCFSRILKVPSEHLSFEQIVTKYELILKNKYPFLEYILNNVGTLKLIDAFQQVVFTSNVLAEAVNKRFTRAYCKRVSIKDFIQQQEITTVNLDVFFNSWRKISRDLGPIQVGCKVYGKMNDTLD